MADDPRYRQRLARAAWSGVRRRLGNRWVQLGLLLPPLPGLAFGFVAGGQDIVTAVQLTLAVAFAGYFLLALIVVLVSAFRAPAEEDARVRSERDDAWVAIADGMTALATGLDQFRLRLDEDNELARKIRQWSPIVGVGPTRLAKRESEAHQYSARREDYIAAVAAWNVACLATVRTYLPYSAPFMERPIVRRDVPRGEDRRLFQIREEVQQKIDWMTQLRSELEAKDRR